MENFNEENFKQLVKFYKDKSSDIELNFLVLQIDIAKSIEILKKKHDDEINEIKNENELHKIAHKNQMILMDQEIIKLRTQLNKKNNKNNSIKKENNKKTK